MLADQNVVRLTGRTWPRNMAVVPEHSFDHSTLTRQNSQYSLSLVLSSFQTSSAQAWKSMRGPELLAQSLTSEASFEAVASTVYLLGELLSRPTKEGESPIVLDDHLNEIALLCVKLETESFLEQARADLQRRRRPGSRDCDPLANLIYVCGIHSIALKWVMVYHRIGRFLHPQLAVLHGQDITLLVASRMQTGALLDVVATADQGKLLRGVVIRYLDEVARGAGVYRDWLGKMLVGMVDDLFELGSDGRYRVVLSGSNEARRRRRFFAVGRVLGMSLTDGLPSGIEFSRGFYQMLLGKKNNYSSADLRLDADDATYMAWSHTTLGGCEGLELEMVSLDTFCGRNQ